MNFIEAWQTIQTEAKKHNWQPEELLSVEIKLQGLAELNLWDQFWVKVNIILENVHLGFEACRNLEMEYGRSPEEVQEIRKLLSKWKEMQDIVKNSNWDPDTQSLVEDFIHGSAIASIDMNEHQMFYERMDAVQDNLNRPFEEMNLLFLKLDAIRD